MEADDLTGAEIATNHADAAIVSDDQIQNLDLVEEGDVILDARSDSTISSVVAAAAIAIGGGGTAGAATAPRRPSRNAAWARVDGSAP